MNGGDPCARVGDGCWRWLDDNRDEFFVHAGDDAPMRKARMRTFIELLIFVTSALRLGVRSMPIVSIASAAQAWIPSFDWESQLMRNPSFVVAVLSVTEFLEAHGGDAAPFRRLVERVIALGIVDGLDQRPYRRVELDRLLVRARFRDFDAPSFSAAVRRALVLLDKPPPLYSVQEYFALTHLVCYVCDDGARDPLAVLDGGEVARLRWLVATLGRITLVDRDLDLAAEFLLCERYLGSCDDAFAREAIRSAARDQEDDGSILAPDAGWSNTPFLRRYHSTLLWAYASLLVRHGTVRSAA